MLYVCLILSAVLWPGPVVAEPLAKPKLHSPQIGAVNPSAIDTEDLFTASEVDPPFFLTTFSEIQELPEKDQKKYIQDLREIVQSFPRDVLTVRSSSECPKDQVLCQPPLFGNGTCVPVEKFDVAVCGQRSSDQKLNVFFREPSSESFWDDFERKISSFCDEASNAGQCKKLEDLRIRLFMARRSH